MPDTRAPTVPQFTRRLGIETPEHLVLELELAGLGSRMAATVCDAGLLVLARSEEHTSELQSPYDLVCRLLLEPSDAHPVLHPFPTRRSSDLIGPPSRLKCLRDAGHASPDRAAVHAASWNRDAGASRAGARARGPRLPHGRDGVRRRSARPR